VHMLVYNEHSLNGNVSVISFLM